MEEAIDYEAPIANFRRLIKRDQSEQFKIIVKYSFDNVSEHEFFIDTTINEARIISYKIDESFQNDPTICQYQIDIPNYFLKENTEESELKEIIQFILNTANQKVHIPKEKLKLFTIFQYLLGECDKEALKKLNLLINNQEEAIQFLNTEFHDLSIQYLSSNLLQLIESGQASTISEPVFNEIIDLYTESLNNDTTQNDDDELIKIFDKMKSANLDRSTIMYFLMHIEFEEFNDDMTEYFDENIDDEILLESLPRVMHLFKKQVKLVHGKKKVKGKITECQFNGNEQSGIFAFINQLCGGDAVNNGLITVRDGLGTDKNTIKNLLYTNSGCYSSSPSNENDAWIEFNFGQRKINLSSYTIRSCSADNGPKTWRISGSNDGSNWTVLNRQVNRNELKSQYWQKRFECPKNEEYYQFIRFIEEESWNSNRYYMHFYYFELFGSILESNQS